jgi:hypothetical protein
MKMMYSKQVLIETFGILITKSVGVNIPSIEMLKFGIITVFTVNPWLWLMVFQGVLYTLDAKIFLYAK